MNTLFENTLLKMGVGLQTMSASKVPAMLKNLFKSQTPLEKLNQERAALGYDPLTQSEWLAGAGAVATVAVTTATLSGEDLDDMFNDSGACDFISPEYSTNLETFHYRDSHDDFYD